jgi:hypothetical protein
MRNFTAGVALLTCSMVTMSATVSLQTEIKRGSKRRPRQRSFQNSPAYLLPTNPRRILTWSSSLIKKRLKQLQNEW